MAKKNKLYYKGGQEQTKTSEPQKPKLVKQTVADFDDSSSDTTIVDENALRRTGPPQDIIVKTNNDVLIKMRREKVRESNVKPNTVKSTVHKNASASDDLDDSLHVEPNNESNKAVAEYLSSTGDLNATSLAVEALSRHHGGIEDAASASVEHLEREASSQIDSPASNTQLGVKKASNRILGDAKFRPVEVDTESQGDNGEKELETPDRERLASAHDDAPKRISCLSSSDKEETLIEESEDSDLDDDDRVLLGLGPAKPKPHRGEYTVVNSAKTHSVLAKATSSSSKAKKVTFVVDSGCSQSHQNQKPTAKGLSKLSQNKKKAAEQNTAEAIQHKSNARISYSNLQWTKLNSRDVEAITPEVATERAEAAKHHGWAFFRTNIEQARMKNYFLILVAEGDEYEVTNRREVRISLEQAVLHSKFFAEYCDRVINPWVKPIPLEVDTDTLDIFVRWIETKNMRKATRINFVLRNDAKNPVRPIHALFHNLAKAYAFGDLLIESETFCNDMMDALVEISKKMASMDRIGGAVDETVTYIIYNTPEDEREKVPDQFEQKMMFRNGLNDGSEPNVEHPVTDEEINDRRITAKYRVYLVRRAVEAKLASGRVFSPGKKSPIVRLILDNHEDWVDLKELNRYVALHPVATAPSLREFVEMLNQRALQRAQDEVQHKPKIESWKKDPCEYHKHRDKSEGYSCTPELREMKAARSRELKRLRNEKAAKVTEEDDDDLEE